MKDLFRFSVAFWHTFRGTGVRANFEFLNKLGVDKWCFHDRDIAPDGKTLEESNANLEEVVALAKELQARFLEAAVAYKKKIGYKGNAADLMLWYQMENLNLTLNATMPRYPVTGWDTDQFLTDIAEATMVIFSVVRNGGLAPGGFNFDAKLQRESTDVEDLFIARIRGMNTLARGLRNVAKLIEKKKRDGSLAELVCKRYKSFDREIGAQIEAGKADFEMLEKVMQ